MKRYLFIFLTLCSFGLQAQVSPGFQPVETTYGSFKFDHHAYELEDNWVAFPKNVKTGKFTFGYIYLDVVAGYTCNMEGFFQVDAQGKVFRDSTDFLKPYNVVKVRLAPNTAPVFAIPANMLADLKVKPVPDWLAVYKRGQPQPESVAMKVLKGKHLNSAGGAKKALEYLESAYAIEPHAAGLEFELTYAYNELGQFAKSVTVLNAAIAYAPQNPMFYRELGFAYMRSNDLESASIAYIKGIELCQPRDIESRIQMVQNLTYVYTQQKQFDKAVQLLNSNLNNAPSIGLYISLAVAYKNAGDADNAIKTYTKAIDMAPATNMEQRAQIAWAIALIYRDQKKDNEQYSVWGKKAKEWVPANSPGAAFLKTVVL